jgi:hypothetical protein
MADDRMIQTESSLSAFGHRPSALDHRMPPAVWISGTTASTHHVDDTRLVSIAFLGYHWRSSDGK